MPIEASGHLRMAENLRSCFASAFSSLRPRAEGRGPSIDICFADSHLHSGVRGRRRVMETRRVTEFRQVSTQLQSTVSGVAPGRRSTERRHSRARSLKRIGGSHRYQFIAFDNFPDNCQPMRASYVCSSMNGFAHSGEESRFDVYITGSGIVAVSVCEQ